MSDSIQRLISLSLPTNLMGTVGAKYLADALEYNQVSERKDFPWRLFEILFQRV